MKAIKISTNKGIGMIKLLVIVGFIGLVVTSYNSRQTAIEEEREAAAEAYAQKQNKIMLKQVQDNMADQMMKSAMKAKYGGAQNLDPEIKKQLQEAQQFNNNYY